MKPIKVGLLGIGTVGAGTFNVLKRNQEEIRRRAGRGIEIAMVADLDTARATELTGGQCEVVNDASLVVNNPDIDIVVELIGGYGIAKRAGAAGDRQRQARRHRQQGAAGAAWHRDLRAPRRTSGVMVAFEAAVAGGIPIIKALREGLSANRIDWVAGIINGTTNFILSEMRDKGLDFDTVLKEAQRLGYAEADPTFDIEGVDAAHKATTDVGDRLRHSGAVRQGARRRHHQAAAPPTSAMPSSWATGSSCWALRAAPRAGIELRVHPTLIPAKRLIANVEGAMNAVLVQGDAVGATLYYGKGAGAEPTASAVIADLVDITRLATADPEHRVPHLAFQPDAMSDIPVLPMSEVTTSYYLRVCVADQLGVLADITRVLADATISIDAMLQKEPDEGKDHTDIILLTHQTQEKNVDAAIARIEALPTVQGKITRIRLEQLA